MDFQKREIPGVSKALRVEFARGDGKVKSREDRRRRNIEPSETLFVVNFHERRTQKQDLQEIFGRYGGDIVRIDMKNKLSREPDPFPEVSDCSLRKDLGVA